MGQPLIQPHPLGEQQAVPTPQEAALCERQTPGGAGARVQDLLHALLELRTRAKKLEETLRQALLPPYRWPGFTRARPRSEGIPSQCHPSGPHFSLQMTRTVLASLGRPSPRPVMRTLSFGELGAFPEVRGISEQTPLRPQLSLGRGRGAGEPHLSRRSYLSVVGAVGPGHVFLGWMHWFSLTRLSPILPLGHG